MNVPNRPSLPPPLCDSLDEAKNIFVVNAVSVAIAAAAAAVDIVLFHFDNSHARVRVSTRQRLSVRECETSIDIINLAVTLGHVRQLIYVVFEMRLSALSSVELIE